MESPVLERATGRCSWWTGHDWTKWRLVGLVRKRVHDDGRELTMDCQVQRRDCLRCGLIETKDIDP